MKKKFAGTAYRTYLYWGICSSMSLTLSTIIDAALIGNYVGSTGLAASGIISPIFMIFCLLGETIGIGANVLIGRALGAADREEANCLMAKQIALGLACSLVLFVLLLVFRNRIFRFLGAGEELFPLVSAYLLPVFFTSPFFLMYHILSASVRTDGNSRLAGAASTLVVLTDLVLDFVFMGGFRLGMLGAGLALSIAEVFGAGLLLTHFFRKLSILRLSVKLPSFKDIRDFVVNGFGVGTASFFQGAIMWAFNQLLLADTVNGITYEAIFGVFYTFSTLPTAFFDGAGGAFAPVLSVFEGERDGESILTVWKQGTVATALMAVVFLLLFECFPLPALRFFGLDGTELVMAVPALRLFTLSLFFAGFNILMTSFWQVIGRNTLSGCMSFFRNFVIVLAAGCILIPRYGIMGLSAAYLCSEVFCLLCVCVLTECVGLFRPGNSGRHLSSTNYVLEKYAPVGKVFEKYYNIRTESVAEIAADLEEICGIWQVDPDQEFFLNFIAEELLLNIIKFGLKDGSGRHYINIRLMEVGPSGEKAKASAGCKVLPVGQATKTKERTHISISIRDDVKAYNPFASEGDNIDMAVLRVIRRKTSDYDYQRKLVFNYLYLAL
ncbi:MAG: hypothetical protein LUD16_02540 [Lachnospiraceae bacterium]|nr:hypothetical protein [Lachnospiraceae bacterium]